MKSLLKTVISIFLLLLSLQNNSAYSFSDHCISPLSSLNNSLYILDEDMLERSRDIYNYSEINTELNLKGKILRGIIEEHQGKVDIFTFNYISDYEKNRTGPESSFTGEKYRSLYLKRINNSKAIPCFFVVQDKKNNNLKDLIKWLQLNFKKRSFIIIPCSNDFDKAPLVDLEPSKYQQWYDFIKLQKKLAFQEQSFLGSEAAELLSGKIENRSYSGALKLSDREMEIIYNDLNTNQVDSLIVEIMQGDYSVKSRILDLLAKRTSFSEYLLRETLKLDDYQYLVKIFRNSKISTDRLIILLFEEIEHISGKTIKHLTEELFKTDPSAAERIFLNFCNKIDFINRNAENEYQKLKPLDVFYPYFVPVNESKYKSPPFLNAVKILYDNDFQDWNKLFVKDYETIKQARILDTFTRTYPYAAGKIMEKLFSENTEYSYELFSKILNNTTNSEDFYSEFFNNLIDKTPSLKTLQTSILLNNTPLPVKIKVIIYASNKTIYYNTESYLYEIREIFKNKYMTNLLNDPSISTIKKESLLQLIASYPFVFKAFEKNFKDYPDRFSNPVHYLLLDENHNFIDKLNTLLNDIIFGRLKNDFLYSRAGLNHLTELLTALISVPEEDKDNIFPATGLKDYSSLEEILKKISKNRSYSKLNIFHSQYPDIPASAVIPLIKIDDHELTALFNEIFSWKEISSHKISRLKLTALLSNPQSVKFTDPLKSLLREFSKKKNQTLKNRKRFIKLLSWFYMFLNLPDQKEISIENILSSEIVKLNEMFYKTHHKLTYTTFMQERLSELFINLIRKYWGLALKLNENISEEILYRRLHEIDNFWLYFNKWQKYQSESNPRPDLVKMLRILSNAVTQYLNFGRDIKNFKYSFLYDDQSKGISEEYPEFTEDTSKSRKQLDLYRKVLESKFDSKEKADFYLKNITKNINEAIKTEDDRIIYAYYTDSIVDALNRGKAGGGNCEDPSSPNAATECVNGTTFSPMTKGVLFGQFPSDNNAILYQFNSLTNVDGELVPVYVNEAFYIEDKLPGNYTKKNYFDAAMEFSLKTAAKYGLDYVFFTTYMTNPNLGCRPVTVPAKGYSTIIEYIDQNGFIIKEQISVEEIISDKRTDHIFYMFEEDNPTKYADNAVSHIGPDGSIAGKIRASISSEINFASDGYEKDIHGIKIRTARNSMEGKLVRISRKELTKKELRLKDRLSLMYRDLPADSQKAIHNNILRIINSNNLRLLSETNINSEILNSRETTLNLINQIADINLATDHYLKIVYKISERLAKSLIKDMPDLISEKSSRVIVTRIPRGGIPVASKIFKTFNNHTQLSISTAAVDYDRSISQLPELNDGDTIVICDQVINSGRTIIDNIKYILNNTGKKINFIITALTADPESVIKIINHNEIRPYIKRIYLADLKKKVDLKDKTTSILGHPGERSFPKNILNLYQNGSVLNVSGKEYQVEEKLNLDYSRSLIVKDKAENNSCIMKIMVSDAEGNRIQSISLLAEEENFTKGILHGVKYYADEAILIYPFISKENVTAYFKNLLQNSPQHIEEAILKLISDLYHTASFLSSQEQLSVILTPDTLLFNPEKNQWFITDYYYEKGEGSFISEAQFIDQLSSLLDHIFEQSAILRSELPARIRRLRSILKNDSIEKLTDLEKVLRKFLDYSYQDPDSSIAKAA